MPIKWFYSDTHVCLSSLLLYTQCIWAALWMLFTLNKQGSERAKWESVETVLAMRAAHVSLVLALLQISWQPFWFHYNTSLQNPEPHTGRHECSGAPQALQVAAPRPSPHVPGVFLQWVWLCSCPDRPSRPSAALSLAARLCPAPIWAQLKKRSPVSRQAPCRIPCMGLAGGSF